MNSSMLKPKLLITGIIASVLLSACVTTRVPDGTVEVREKLNQLQTNRELASRAPIAIREAEEALRLAEIPQQNHDLSQHRLLMADHKVDIAAARAQARLYEDQRAGLREDSEGARLESRTMEADKAHRDVLMAREDAGMARRETMEMQRQLEALKAQETERGIIVTLGDLLFATGRSEILGSSGDHLAKLASFLNQYPERQVVIEGHTDSVGTETSNHALSQQRADAVRDFLMNHGVTGSRLRTIAMGENSPVATNDSAGGRQQNRRVEVVIENSAPGTQ